MAVVNNAIVAAKPSLKRRCPSLRGTGKVTVTYKPTEIARHYRYNVVLPPHDQFDRELKMNLFKTR